MVGTIRRAKDTRTLAATRGSGTHSNERHVHQFQLATLELERTRRLREKQVATQRIKEIDARLDEVDELIRKHQEVLNVTACRPGAATEPIRAAEPLASPRRVLRYGR